VEEQARLTAFMAQVSAGRQAATDVRLVAKHSEKEVWLNATGTRVPTGDEEHLLIIGIDITERKQVEEAVRESEQDMALAQRVAHLGSWTWEAATDTVKWSPELYRINGRDPQSPAPSLVEQQSSYTPESWERLRTAVGLTLATRQPYDLELQVIRSDGTPIWLAASGEARTDEQGRVVGARGTAQDITDRKRAQIQLEAQLGELRRWHTVTLGREDRVRQLKSEVNEVCRRAGEPLRYPSQATGTPDTGVVELRGQP
jgi:PAS domain S-box-containing protein